MPHLGRTGVKGTLAALYHLEFENMFITVLTALLSYASSFWIQALRKFLYLIKFNFKSDNINHNFSETRLVIVFLTATLSLYGKDINITTIRLNHRLIIRFFEYWVIHTIEKERTTNLHKTTANKMWSRYLRWGKCSRVTLLLKQVNQVLCSNNFYVLILNSLQWDTFQECDVVSIPLTVPDVGMCPHSQLISVSHTTHRHLHLLCMQMTAPGTLPSGTYAGTNLLWVPTPLKQGTIPSCT